MNLKFKLTIILMMSSGLSLTAGLMTTGASLANSGIGIAVKGVSKSLTSIGAGASSTSDTTSSKKDKPYVLNLDFISEPELYRNVYSKTQLRYDATLSENDINWASSILNSINFPYHNGTLTIKKGIHKLQKRRKKEVVLLGASLYISPAVFKQQQSNAILSSLALKSWAVIGQNNRSKYTQICGWKSHSFIPGLKVNSLNTFQNNGNNPKEDYILNILKTTPTEVTTSRSVFFRQMRGLKATDTNDMLEQFSVDFCFIEDKGFAGASQGHCAIVLNTPEGKKLSFSYTADFDFSTPLKSATKALIGTLPRSLRCIEYAELKKIYKAENRVTILEKLNLSNREKNDLLFRLRECFDIEDGQYSFLRQNCANPLRDILLYSIHDNNLKGWKTPLTLWNWSKSLRPLGEKT
jgi:hypothetical protein